MKYFNKLVLTISISISIILIVIYLIVSSNLNKDLQMYRALMTSPSGNNRVEYAEKYEETEEQISKNNILPIVSVSTLVVGIVLSYFINGFSIIVDSHRTKQK